MTAFRIAKTRCAATALALCLAACGARDDAAPATGPAPAAPPPAQPAAPTAPPAADDDFEFETPRQAAPMLLSELGLFEDLARQLPAKDVIAYTLQTEHFADYATVRRYLRLPDGATMEYRSDGALAFPEGTIIAQTFGYPDGDALRPIETRILQRDSEGWDGLAYLWNAGGTDARRALAGGIVEVANPAGDAGGPFKYLVPNRNDCKRCHEIGGAMQVLGVTAANLNTTLPQPEAPGGQLATWAAAGRLQGLPAGADALPRLPRWSDAGDGTVEARARAWLDVNCAHCHNPDGAGGVSGLDLRLSQTDPVRYGIFKPPVAAGRGSEGHRFSIEPAHPERSFLVSRLMSVDVSVMMPPVGRRLVCTEAVDLVAAWIGGLEFSPDESVRLVARQREIHEQLLKDQPAAETTQ